ncbi:Putative Flp pilus-assembly TadE/G-like [Sulfitobacter brevis]|uniref:Putative Flp pilus-assembly TadE/G-like n=1 Tax=Sulfitobacter brevis TaxID=74348 RepID=A0A1I1Y016_9RHOB|nr:TadE/TadG family type IV pilus assembly protein [Sulfitobacter brevis]SFE11100.1 Putative Flp pilus-assembly TadE/G-like [Sulfitobacter brevis]
MPPRSSLKAIKESEDGGVLVIWALALVIFLGLIGIIFDIGRLATTQAELQSFADSVSLSAAAELDGRADAISRAQTAATTLIRDTQTYGDGGAALGAEDFTLTFYSPGSDGQFSSDAARVTTNPHNARFVTTRVNPRRVAPGLGAAFAALSGTRENSGETSAQATAGFSLEACNVAPVAVCLPTIDFDAATSIGQTLELQATVGIGQLLPGQLSAVNSLTNALDGLSICAGLLGGSLEACLIASREPETACTGRGGLELSADISGSGVLDAINTRFDQFGGVAAGLQNNPAFSGAPNVLTGITNRLGQCNFLPGLLNGLLGGGSGAGGDLGLPADDCVSSGACGIQGDGTWEAGRTAYINAHYKGTDPHPSARTRFAFYQAEIAASAQVTGIPVIGNLLGGFTGQMCAPQPNKDPTRRLMVVAGIDCLSANVDAAVSVPPVQQFFEVFALGPVSGGKLSVEITACLGGGCGGGNLDTEVKDIVRLVE